MKSVDLHDPDAAHRSFATDGRPQQASPTWFRGPHCNHNRATENVLGASAALEACLRHDAEACLRHDAEACLRHDAGACLRHDAGACAVGFVDGQIRQEKQKDAQPLHAERALIGPRNRR